MYRLCLVSSIINVLKTTVKKNVPSTHTCVLFLLRVGRVGSGGGSKSPPPLLLIVLVRLSRFDSKGDVPLALAKACCCCVVVVVGASSFRDEFANVLLLIALLKRLRLLRRLSRKLSFIFIRKGRLIISRQTKSLNRFYCLIINFRVARRNLLFCFHSFCFVSLKSCFPLVSVVSDNNSKAY